VSDLVEKAEEVARNAYAPYSNYFVGAVVRVKDGREFSGVNVENAAYPLGVCAEKIAIGAAATAGCKPGDLEAIGRHPSCCPTPGTCPREVGLRRRRRTAERRQVDSRQRAHR
jgi:homotetrameric cytidine deaminase